MELERRRVRGRPGSTSTGPSGSAPTSPRPTSTGASPGSDCGDAAGAVDDLTTALDRGATETRIYFLRAEARAGPGDAGGAERDRAEGLRRTPVDAESWVARGLARLPGDPAGALADFEAALRARPAVAGRPCRTRRRSSPSASAAPAEAVAMLDRAVALYPDFTPARVGRGVLLARLGRREDAHRDAEEARRGRRLGRDRLPRRLHLRPDLEAEPADRAAGPADAWPAALGREGVAGDRPDRRRPRPPARRRRVPRPAPDVRRPAAGPRRRSNR